MITLSIGIVTRNRSHSLGETLRSLYKQIVIPFEVIISDDSNQPNEIQANQLLAVQYNCRYVVGPQKGLYANRNFVAKQCSGSHIRSMDDDHQFPEGHLEACMAAIYAEPETIWTIGEYNINQTRRSQPFPMPGQLHPMGYSVKPSEMSNYYGISCGGTLYPRSVIDKGILNVEFYKFGIVYLEYGARLKYLGYTLKILPTTYIIHNDTITTASDLNKTIINEARIFATLCFSFKYQPTIKNKMLTVIEIIKSLLFGKAKMHNIRQAYDNFKIISKRLV